MKVVELAHGEHRPDGRRGTRNPARATRQRNRAALSRPWREWSLIIASTAMLCHSANAQQVRNPAADKRAAASSNLPPPPEARFVKLEELGEWTGMPWASVAEFDLFDTSGALLDRSKWKATANSWDTSDLPANAIDGNPKSIWHSRWQGEPVTRPHVFIVDLGSPKRITGFRYLPRQDKVVNGTIAKFRFYVSEDGNNWKEPVASGDFSKMGAPASAKTIVFAKQTPNRPPRFSVPGNQSAALAAPVKLQMVASDPDGDALKYAAKGLPEGLELSPTSGLISGAPVAAGDFTVEVTAHDGKGPPVPVTLKWTVKPAPLRTGAAPGRKGEVRFAKFVALSEVSGKSWASIAEFNLIDAKGDNLPRAGWSVAAGSADESDRAANATDDSPSTIWHSRWSSENPPGPPHTFLIDLGGFMPVHGFKYLPRQDKLANGAIGKYQFYLSADGVTWGRPVAEGDFSSSSSPRSEKTVWLK